MPLLREPGAPAPYQQIREILRKEILENMKPGDRIAAERDLARRFDANRATISRAIASLVNEGLLTRRVGRGTFVSKADEVLRRSKSRSVGLVIPYIPGDFPGSVVRSAVRAFKDQDYRTMLFDSENSNVVESQELDSLLKEGLDGALIMPVDRPESTPMFSKLVRLGFPMVFLDRRPLDLDIDLVATDNFWGSYEATTRLIRRGHRRIAHFTWLIGRESTAIRDRRAGYEQALIDSGIEVDPELICPPAPFPDDESAFKHILAYLRTGDRPITAVLALNDLFAVAAMAGCRALGLRVPDDIEIAAFFDGVLKPPVRFLRIVQDQEEIGRKAVDLLMRRIEANGPEGPQTILVRPRIFDEAAAPEQAGTALTVE